MKEEIERRHDARPVRARFAMHDGRVFDLFEQFTRAVEDFF